MLFSDPMVIHSQRGDGRHWFTTMDVPSLQIWPVAPNQCRVGHFLAKVIAGKLATLTEDATELVLTRADVAAVESLSDFSELIGEAADVRLRLLTQAGPGDSGSDKDDDEDDDGLGGFITPQPPTDWTLGYDAWIVFAGRSLGMDAPESNVDPTGHEQDMAKASTEFQTRIQGLRTRFLAGMEGLNLGFKVVLTTDSGDKEYVWVRPIAWQDEKTVECILESEPYACKGYKHGQKLSLAVTDLFDYAIGSEEGGLVDGGVTQRIAEDYGLILPE
ncbi:MAG: hypothetical protein V4857_19390 [Pseudomonadota bacterium]